MSRIFCIVGKSSSGKDTIYKKILSNNYPDLIPVIPYTTRPKRTDEKDGVDYNFVTEEQLNEFEQNNQIIEKRQYSTTQGIWTYFTLKFDILSGRDYILITTAEGAASIILHYGADMINIVYLYVGDEKTRLIRCIERESKQTNPDYIEVCRRFIADEYDFAQDRLDMLKGSIYKINTEENISDCMKKWNEIYENNI